MRPCWITQDSDLATALPISSPEQRFHTIVCCTASHRVEGSEGSEGGYIQGAGDDSEGWAHGLTPELFWKNRMLLMGTDENKLEGLIRKLVKEWGEESGTRKEDIICVDGKGVVCIGTMESITRGNEKDEEGKVVIICGKEDPCKVKEWEEGVRGKERRNKSRLHLDIPNGKLGSKALRSELPRLRSFLDVTIARSTSPPTKILCACPSGRDLSIGVALTILCLYFDEDGKTCCLFPLFLFDVCRRPKQTALAKKNFLLTRLPQVLSLPKPATSLQVGSTSSSSAAA